MHATKAYKGRRGLDPLILHLNTGKEMRGHLQAPATLHKGQELTYPSKRRLDGPQSWSICFGEDTNLLPLSKIKPQIFHSVVMLLYWLCYPTFLEWKLFKINLFTTVVTYGRVLSTKRYKDMPLCQDGKNYPIKKYYVPVLPNVTKIWIHTKATISRLTANEATFPNLLRGKP